MKFPSCAWWTILVATAISLPAQGQDLGFVAAALGTSDQEWTLESGSTERMTVVNQSGTIGEALKLTIGPGGSTVMASTQIMGPAEVRFRYAASNPRGVGLVFAEDGNGYSNAIHTPEIYAESYIVGTWEEGIFELTENRSYRVGFALGFTPFAPNEGDWMILDEFHITRGASFTATAIGGTVPDGFQDVVLPAGSLATVEALPAEPGLRFLYWTDEKGAAVTTDNPLYEVITEPAARIAWFGREFAWKGFDWVTPADPGHGFTMEMVGPDDERLVYRGEVAGGMAWLETWIAGPGVLRLDWEAAPAQLITSSLPGFSGYTYMLDAAIPFTWRVPAGVHRLRLAPERDFDLKDLTIMPGYVVTVATGGMGTVAGAPEDGMVDPGESVTLVATPAEGWEFDRWSGAIESTQNLLTLVPTDHSALTAQFVQRFSVPGGELIILSGEGWTIEAGEDGLTIHSPTLRGGGEAATIVFEREDAGWLSYEFWTTGEGRVKTVDTVGAGFQYLENPGTSYGEYPVGPQSHRWTVHLHPAAGDEQTGAMRIERFRWEPGVPVAISGGAGGTIDGVPASARVPAGTVLELEAVAEEGFAFDRWEGVSEFPFENPKRVVAEEALTLRALFKRSVTVGSYTVSWDGSTPWTWDGDLLVPPAVLPAGHTSVELIVDAPVFGGMRLEIVDLAPERDGGEPPRWYRGAGGFPEMLSPGEQTIFIDPGGWSRLELWGGADGDRYHPYGVRLIGHEYSVNLTGTKVSISTDPPIAGRVLEGTTVTFEVQPSGGYVFAGWSGDLAGQGAVGSFVVGGNLSAAATATLPAAELAFAVGSGWQFNGRGSTVSFRETLAEPYAAAWPEGGFEVWGEGSQKEGTFSASVSGEGLLRFRIAADRAQVRLGARLVSNVSRFVAEGTEILIPVPAGEHSLAIEVTSFNYTGNPVLVSDLRFEEGVFVEHSAEVLVDPDKTLYARGESVTLTAVPTAGTTFVDWQGVFAGQPPSFTTTVEESVVVALKTEAEAELRGVAFTYDGIRPTFREGTVLGLTGGGFYAALDAADGGSETGVGATFTGPGELRWRLPSAGSSTGRYVSGSVLVDGVPHGPWKGFSAYDEYRLLLEEGESRVVEMVFAYAGELPTAGAFLPLASFPTLHSEYSLVVEPVEDVSVNRTPWKSLYAAGEQVTLTANLYGAGIIVGWERFEGSATGHGEWVAIGTESVLVLAMEGSQRVRAVVGEPEPREFFDGLPAQLDADWTWSGNGGPEGSSGAWQASPARYARAALSWRPGGVVVTDVWIRGTGGTFSLRRDGSTVSLGRAETWRRMVLTQDPDDPWTLTFEASANGAEALVAPVAVEAGRGVNVVVGSHGTVEFPAGLVVTAGNPLPVRAVAEAPHRFVAWESGAQRWNEAVIELEVGTPALHQAIFTVPLEAFGQSWTVDPVSSWSGSAGRLSVELDRRGPSTAGLEVTGPATIALKYAAGWPTLEPTRLSFRIDGEPAWEGAVSTSWEERALVFDIPPGEHLFSIDLEATALAAAPRTASIEVRDFALNPGYRLDVRASGGGQILRVPDKAHYAPGEEVQLIARADEGYAFAGWSGALSGAERLQTLTMNGPRDVTATFDGTVLRFAREWKLWNVSDRGDVTYENTWWLGPGNAELGPGWIETTLEGPGVLRLGGGYSDEYFRSRGVWLDGAWLPDPWDALNDSDATPIEMTIADGTHTLRLPMNEGRLTGLADLAFFPGYQLRVIAPDGAVTLDPRAETYAPGTAVTLTARPDAGTVAVEWLEFEESGTEPIAVTMDRHRRLSPFFWREILFEGRRFRYTGATNDVYRHTWGDFGEILWIQDPVPGAFRFLELTLEGPLELVVPYGFSGYQPSPDASYELAIDGVSLGAPALTNGGSWAFRLGMGKHTIRWNIRKMGENSLHLRDLEFSFLASDPFGDWLKTRVSSEIYYDLARSAKEVDLDGDGLSLHLEYLLDLDPLGWERILAAEPWEPGGAAAPLVRVWYPRVPEVHASNFVVEYSTAFEGNWTAVDERVLDLRALTDDDGLIWDQLDLSFGEALPESLFFRLRYTGGDEE
jgi:hypothetical protein